MHPDLPAFHTSTFPDWTKNSFVIESNPQVYHHSTGGYPITATASTPSYCSNFSEASHSSPTLFWAAPTPTTAATVEENALFTTGEIASTEINPVKSAEISTSEVIFENTSEIRNLEPQNKSNQYIYHPHQSVSQNSSKEGSEDFYNNKASKAHARFKSANTCLSSYDERSNQKHTQQFLSPPLPSSSLGQASIEDDTSLTASKENICGS
jgi:hypothetical protein